MGELPHRSIEPQPENYDLIYTGALYPESSQIETLERLYQTFNIDHPADFTGHSLSVSDIVAPKQNGVVSCHYVDSVGYKELPSFIQSGNYLKNAEMQMEDDYGIAIIARTVEILDSGFSCSITHSVSRPGACVRFSRAYAEWFVLPYQIPFYQRDMRPIRCM